MSDGTVQHWAKTYVTSTSLTHKLKPPAPPTRWSMIDEATVLERPGRPKELELIEKSNKRPRSIVNATRRAEVIHTFLHHELQAAELMAWGILAYPDTPLAFRRGLLNICRDELRHLDLYAQHLETLGHPYGSFPVNDWFWKRVPGADVTPTHFVARLGIGFEGGNLDHGIRFVKLFRDAGDDRAAEIQQQIVDEEEAHAAFALHWFREFTGAVDFEHWREHLAPLSPMMTRGHEMNLDARRRAGFPESFLLELAKWARDAA